MARRGPGGPGGFQDKLVTALDTDKNGTISAAEIAAAPQSLRTLDEFIEFLRRLYNRDVREDDAVTVIHFSEIR